MSLRSPSVTCTLVCALLWTASLSAQQVKATAPVGIGAAGMAQMPGADPGVRVEMIENHVLDSYLERAQSFLDRSDYTAAVEVLQNVIEGETVTVFGTGPPADGSADGLGGEPKRTSTAAALLRGMTRGGPEGKSGPSSSGPDARNAVFSRDGRLYQPVRRLCHELLSRMPDVGIQIYRAQHEFAAEELLAKATASGSAALLEQVASRYFVTVASGRAMRLLADRLMHDGRYRAAVQVLGDLLEVYPAQNRKALGIRDAWCQFKIALCLQMVGEQEAARAAVDQLAEAHEQESLRIRGQLESVRDLPQGQLFSRDTADIDPVTGSEAGIAWLQNLELLPLWQYRFATEDPYRDPKPSNRNRSNIWIDGGSRVSAMPIANRYGPGTRVAFVRERDGDHVVPRAIFLEHYRLRLADGGSGIQLRQSDGPDAPAPPRENHPRVRIAAVDYALLRPVEDNESRFVILGHEGNTTTSKAAWKASHLVAYDKGTWQRRWTSEDWHDGEHGLRNVTFLAAPTVSGGHLLLPALRKDAYTLECLDRKTGQPLWHCLLHMGGSPFFKAPGCPVVVRGGVAYVATNAGCVAAVDAIAGELRWIRRYERRDLAHKAKLKAKRARNRQQFGYSEQFSQRGLDSFTPSELILHGGLLVLAPCDGEVLLGLDAASGKPAWLLDGHTHYAPYGRLIDVVGHNDELLFALSESHLVCMELDGGLVRWQKRLPSWSGPRPSGRGRGLVLGSAVIVPNSRELLIFDADNKLPMRRLPLPTFGESREPLSGSCHVVSAGPWIAVGYAGGVEVFSTKEALGDLAEATLDPLRQAFYMTLGGAVGAAEKVLASVAATSEDMTVREDASSQLLSLVTARAYLLAGEGKASEALKVMDEVRALMVGRPVRLSWHLARIEICTEAGDLRAHESEQQSLYYYMEGR